EAVVALDGRMTYRELDESTDVLAAGLAGLGLVPGDPVLFQVTNRLGAILAWYGVLKAGLVPVCTLAAHRGHEIGEISRRTGAVAHLVEAGTRGFDLVGFAAGQRRDHPTLRHLLVLGAAADQVGDTGGVAIESLGAGGCLVLGTPDLDASLPLMARERATHVLLGHGHFNAVAEAGFAAATASVTQVVLSGTKVPPALFDELEQRGLWSGQLFGMGEGLFLTTRPGAPREARATTVGTPQSPMDEIRIL